MSSRVQFLRVLLYNLLFMQVCLTSAHVISPKSGFVIQRTEPSTDNRTLTTTSAGPSSISDTSGTTSVRSSPTVTSANQTFSLDGSFPYLIPYSTSQSCDIFGPICQPGSITVNAVGNDRQTSRTTLVCSSYLAAQSTYLETNKVRTESWDPDDYGFTWPQGWGIEFGRDPKCYAYEHRLSPDPWQSPGAKPDLGPWTFSQCKGKDAVGTVTSRHGGPWLPWQVPAGFDYAEGDTMHPSCCGLGCNMALPDYQLWYFRDEGAEEYCRARGRKISGLAERPTTTSALGQQGKRHPKRIISAKSNSAGQKTAVISGHTMTSPSLYLELMGTASAYDDCGPLGTAVTSAFLAIPPNQLTTITTSRWRIGDDAYGDGYYSSQRLTLADLDCPTFGYGFAGGTSYTVGPPWLPFIETPDEVWNLNKEWANVKSFCTHNFPSFDPPKVMEAVDAINGPTGPDEPKPTPLGPSDHVKGEDPAQPGSQPNADQPAQTNSPGKGGEGVEDSQAGMTDPDPVKEPASYKPQPQKNKGGEGSEQDTKEPGKNAPSENSAPNPDNKDPSPKQSNPSNTGHKAPPVNPIVIGTHTVQHPDPTGFEVAGQSIRPGSPAVTIAGTPVALDQSHNLVLGGKTIDLDSGSGSAPGSGSDSTIPVITVGGQTLTANPNAFAIGDIKITPGGPAATISGTLVSLGPSGDFFVVGDKTVSLDGNDVRSTPSKSPSSSQQQNAAGGKEKEGGGGSDSISDAIIAQFSDSSSGSGGNKKFAIHANPSGPGFVVADTGNDNSNEDFNSKGNSKGDSNAKAGRGSKGRQTHTLLPGGSSATFTVPANGDDEHSSRSTMTVALGTDGVVTVNGKAVSTTTTLASALATQEEEGRPTSTVASGTPGVVTATSSGGNGAAIATGSPSGGDDDSSSVSGNAGVASPSQSKSAAACMSAPFFTMEVLMAVWWLSTMVLWLSTDVILRDGWL